MIPFPGFSAMMLFGVVFARRRARPLSVVTINHEAIHGAQARDCGGYFAYYLRYFGQWMKYGYRAMPFEREAYAYERDIDYLKTRPAKNWSQFVKK